MVIRKATNGCKFVKQGGGGGDGGGRGLVSVSVTHFQRLMALVFHHILF